MSVTSPGSVLPLRAAGAGIAIIGVLLLGATVGPWFSAQVENSTWIESFPGTPIVGYREGGDRIIIQIAGTVLILLGALWALRPVRPPRPLVVLAATISLAWSALPILEAGSIPSRSGLDVGLRAGWGPWAVAVLSLAAIVVAVLSRPTAAAGLAAQRAAVRDLQRGRGMRAIARSESAVRTLQRTLGSAAPETIRAAIDYAECLTAEGYRADARTVLDAAERNLVGRVDHQATWAIAAIRAHLDEDT